MSTTPLEAGGLKALETERERRRAAERTVRELRDQLRTVQDPRKLWERFKAADERAELWEFRAKENGREVKWFKEQFLKYRDLYQEAQTKNNIYAD